MEEYEWILENERLQMEQIRQLDMEELEIEEVDQPSDEENPSENIRDHGSGGTHLVDGFTYDRSLASLHTYLGDVDDAHGRLAFLDGGAILNLPLISLQGVVLFPGATLPLRVLQQWCITCIERALRQDDTPRTIGVVGNRRSSVNGRPQLSAVGTTAEIQKFKRLDDGSLNVVARGQQRFRLRRCWIDVEGVPTAEVQIIQEDAPLRIPKAAFGQMAAKLSFSRTDVLNAEHSYVIPSEHCDPEDSEDDECISVASILSDPSTFDSRTPPDSPLKFENLNVSPTSDEETFRRRGRNLSRHFNNSQGSGRSQTKNFGHLRLQRFSGASASYWPNWVYQMYDSYLLARRAAALWKRIIRTPCLDELVKKPDLLSFSIASMFPVSDFSRQELLEIDGVVYRLQREIELLKSFNLICCKNCLSVIAKRSDTLVMSTDGPLGAYVNPSGCVHEVITVFNTSGLSLVGAAVEEHSWFPGYAWTVAYCTVCDSHAGWRFTATRKQLLPRAFWGIRSSQVKDGTES